MSERIWALAPADLGTLWEECRRCFYLAAGAGFPRPAATGGTSLDIVGRQLVAALGGRRTESVAPGMPAGVLEFGQRSVQSQPLSIQVPDSSYRCVIRGALDLTLALDDASLGVLEVACAGPRAAARLRRLHAWAHALESAGAGKVTSLGVLLFEPEPPPAADAPVSVAGTWEWVPLERDDPAFYGFLAEALSLLERPEPPGGTPLCVWCVYRDASRRTGH
jgi:hypothetical protein